MKLPSGQAEKVKSKFEELAFSTHLLPEIADIVSEGEQTISPNGATLHILN